MTAQPVLNEGADTRARRELSHPEHDAPTHMAYTATFKAVTGDVFKLQKWVNEDGIAVYVVRKTRKAGKR